MKDKVVGIAGKIQEREDKKKAEITGDLAQDIYEVICQYETTTIPTALGALEVVKWILIRDSLGE